MLFWLLLVCDLVQTECFMGKLWLTDLMFPVGNKETLDSENWELGWQTRQPDGDIKAN